MVDLQDPVEHRRLSCGIELAVQPLPDRRLAAMDIRCFAGYAFEAPDRLGVTHVFEEAISKGTARRDGRALSDAFDEIGATHGSYAGRETVGFSSVCLPEFLSRCVELHAEVIRTPTFPEDVCEVAVQLAQQELAALGDDPGELAKKYLHAQAYRGALGRHPLGEAETLGGIVRDDIVAHWRRFVSAPRMQVAVAGAVDPEEVADVVERHFEGFIGDGAAGDDAAEAGFPLEFVPGRSHHHKELEQEQVALCFPGSAVTDDDFAAEKVTMGVLSGGMSCRLFTEVREKQGLVYWVDAWSDHPRRGGMIHLGASSTPRNVSRTFTTLLRELDRLADDVTQAEIDRAVTGIVAKTETRGDVTRSRTHRLADDLFYYGRPVPLAEKLDRIRAVTVDDVKRYLHDHPRDALSVVTVGPQGLET